MEGRPPVIDYEGSDYQESFWEQGEREYEDRAEQIALRRLMPPNGQRLLELGAGAGRNTPRYLGFTQIVLVDYSHTQLERARRRLDPDRPAGPATDEVRRPYIYVAADIYRLPFAAGNFDAATMIRTLHHMADAPQALRQVRQALKPASVFIVEFANKQNLKAMLRYALGRQSWSPYSPEAVEFAPLNFDFHPRTVRSWLKETGFTLRRQLTVSHFRIGLLKRLFPAGLLAGLDGLAQLTGDWWQVTPSVFVRAEADAAGTDQTGGILQFRCPECGHAPLSFEISMIPCPACGRLWGYADGIFDFRKPL